MDLNNEMILMRKTIRRAKGFVTTKLIRHIRSLKDKKGSEKQMLKNNNRMKKLVEEIDIIKDLKSDKIFKYLLTSNLTLEEVSKQSVVNLHERACVRVGLVPFIRQRMKTIRDRVEEFDKNRSNKEEITSLKIAEKLISSDRNDIKAKNISPNNKRTKKKSSKGLSANQTVDSSNVENSSCEERDIVTEYHCENNDESNHKTKEYEKTNIADITKDEKNVYERSEDDSTDVDESDLFEKRDNDSDADQLNAPRDFHVNSAKKSVKVDNHNRKKIAKTKTSTLDSLPNHEKEVPDSDHHGLKESEDDDASDDNDDASDEASEDSGSECEEGNASHEFSEASSYEESIIDSSDIEDQDIEVVLPKFYAKSTDSSAKDRKHQKRGIVVLADNSPAGDVSQVLTNVGKGYADSDEEEAAIKKRRWANFQSDSEDDDFFISNKPSGPRFKPKDSTMNSQLKKLMDMNPTVTKKGDEDFERPRVNKFFSQFADLQERNTSLSRWGENQGSHKRSYNKSEPALRKSVSKPHEIPRRNTASISQYLVETQPVVKLHPSWEASKKKKQQNKIMQFTGTRIQFDDSD